MDNEIHREQTTVYMIEPLKQWLPAHGLSAFVGGNSYVYDDPHLKRKALGPDFYVVNGGRQRRQGKWVTWEEQNLFPTLVVEMLSPKTEKNDRTSKFERYRDQYRCPDYFLLNSENQTLEGFHLVGRAYVVVTPDSDGRLACSSLPLKLGFHNGWLRFFELDGTLVPTAEEVAARERERAQQAEEVAARERERAQAAEEELRRLRAEFDRLRPQSDSDKD